LPTVDLLALATDFIVLLAVLLLCALTLGGWGRLTLRLLGVATPRTLDTATVWLGFAVICAMVELIQLFAPINWVVSVITIAIGLSAYPLEQAFLLTKFFRKSLTFLNIHRVSFSCVALVLVVWCLRAMGSPNNVDSGLYHFQSIRWLNEHPLIAGLANIHWRFAFNQSYFGFLALLNFYPIWGKGYAAGGLFLLMLSFCTLIEVGLRQARSWQWLVGGVLLIYFGYVAGTIANPAPDIAIGLVEIAIALLLMRLAFAEKISEQTDRDFVTLALLCFTAVTIKLSGVAFAAVSIVCALTFIRFRLYAGVSALVKLASLLLVAIIIHSIRSYELSGTIMFPSTFLALWQKEWTLQAAQIRFETDLILSLARQPDILDPALVLGNWQWLPGWLQRLPLHLVLIFGIAFVGMLISVAALFASTRSTQTNASRDAGHIRLSKRLNALYLPLVCSLIFWFLTAPDLRFLGAVLPLYVATALWLAARQIHFIPFIQDLSRRCSGVGLQRLAVLVVLTVSLKLTGVRAVSLEGWQAVPQVSAALQRTDSGFDIFLAGDGGFCWDHPLPCTPVFHPNLRFKDAPWVVFGTNFTVERKYFTTRTNPDPTANQIYQHRTTDGSFPAATGVDRK
jgi:hypothetical protein